MPLGDCIRELQELSRRRNFKIFALSAAIVLVLKWPAFVFLFILWAGILVGMFVDITILLKISNSSIPSPFHVYIAIVVCSTFFGGLLKAYNDISVRQSVFLKFGPPLSCSSRFLRYLIGEGKCIEYAAEISKSLVWELNPFCVAIKTTRDLCLLLAESVGKIAGRFVYVFFTELPFYLNLATVFMLIFCCLSSVLMMGNYSGKISVWKDWLCFEMHPAQRVERPTQRVLQTEPQPQVMIERENYLQ